jgi:hypothetical protein
VIRTGIIGLSEGNGHPFSFSAILNGYNDRAFADAGWPGIHDYLRREPAERFGIADARIVAAWTQDDETTRRLCAACGIERACEAVDDMVGRVDAVIVARDDWPTHAPLAMPFLERGVPVFVDKPLTLDRAELDAFEPYLRRGLLMSCAGLRYAAELDPLRGPVETWGIGELRLIVGTVVLGVERYGIHLLEALASLGGPFAEATLVQRLDVPYEGFVFRLGDGTPFVLNCLGPVGKTFHFSFFGTRSHRHVDLHDNFSAFRRTLEAFFAMVATGVSAIAPDETLRLMRLLADASRRREEADARA